MILGKKPRIGIAIPYINSQRVRHRGVIFGSLGILFALLSRTEDKFESYAKAGLITSSIAFVLVVLVIIVFLGTAAMSSLGFGGVFS